ncbi:MAG: Dot/Icm secretion system protein IcmQ [Legionella sp.]|nr:Dot/Icm secretion system protein IcmQ [Legionella sp.]
MKDELTESQVNAVLKALDDALDQGPWEESNFLRVIGKNLREIRDDLTSHINKNVARGTEQKEKKMAVLQSGQQEVFIALYSSEGNQLQSWERIIANLQRQMISRPIYAQESDVQFLIKSKENKLNEAYVVIVVNEEDILTVSSDKIPRDKFGKPLMSLKDRSLNLNNITRFVHLSGAYDYTKGRLIKKNQPD